MDTAHYWKLRRYAISSANQLTSASQEQHQPFHVKGKGWLVRNVVRQTILDSRLWDITKEFSTISQDKP